MEQIKFNWTATHTQARTEHESNERIEREKLKHVLVCIHWLWLWLWVCMAERRLEKYSRIKSHHHPMLFVRLLCVFWGFNNTLQHHISHCCPKCSVFCFAQLTANLRCCDSVISLAACCCCCFAIFVILYYIFLLFIKCSQCTQRERARSLHRKMPLRHKRHIAKSILN